MQKIRPCLWFDNQAEEAVNFYTSVFKNSKGGAKANYDEATSNAGHPKGSVMTVEFELEGQLFLALNGGPMFKFNEAVSLMVYCKDQEEIDYYWNKLTSEGGQESMCGWLKDKFGLSWQIVPAKLEEFLSGSDKEGQKRYMAALMKMKKLNIKELEEAYNGN